MLEQYGLILALLCAALAILYGVLAPRWIPAQPAGTAPRHPGPRATRRGTPSWGRERLDPDGAVELVDRPCLGKR